MRLLYFFIISYFIGSLTRHIFENTTVFKRVEGSLIIKPNYVPLIPRFIIRGVFAVIALAIFVGTLFNAVNHRQLDEEMIAIIFLVFLTGYVLWSLFKKTRKTLRMVVIPITILDNRRKAIAIGKDIKLSTSDIIALYLQTVEVIGDYIVVSYSLKVSKDHREYHICNRVYTKDEFLKNIHEDVKISLSHLVSNSDKLSDHLIKINWDKLQTVVGHQSSVQL